MALDYSALREKAKKKDKEDWEREKASHKSPQAEKETALINRPSSSPVTPKPTVNMREDAALSKLYDEMNGVPDEQRTQFLNEYIRQNTGTKGAQTFLQKEEWDRASAWEREKASYQQAKAAERAAAHHIPVAAEEAALMSDDELKANLNNQFNSEEMTKRYKDRFYSMSNEERKLVAQINAFDEGYNKDGGARINAAAELKNKYNYTNDDITAMVYFYNRYANKEKAKQENINARVAMEQHPFLESLASVPKGVAGGVMAAVGIADSAIDNKSVKKIGITDQGLDYNNEFSKLQREAQSGRDEFTDTHDFMIGDYDVGDMLYNTAMSGLESGAAAFVPGGAAILGVNAATAKANELAQRGLSTDKAIIGGVAAGAFETIFEKVSIGNIKALQEVDAKTFKDVAFNIAKSMGVNFAEEAATEFANIAYDTIAHGDKSEWQMKINELVTSGGMSEKEAFKDVLKGSVLQVIEAGASGALMGAGFGAAGAGSSYVANRASLSNAGTVAAMNEQTGAIIAEGQAAPEGSDARKLADKLAVKQEKGKNVSDYKLGLLQHENSRQGRVTEGTFAGIGSQEELKKAYTDEIQKINIERTVSDNKIEQLYNDRLTQKKADRLYDEYKAAEKQLEKSKGRDGMQEAFSQRLQEDIKNRAESERLKPEIKTADGSAAKLDGSGIFRTADGKNAVKTEDGKEHNISDITFGDENVQRLYDATEGMTAENANLFVSEYNGETVAEYKAATEYFYRLGSTGMTAEKIRNAFKPEWADYLSEEAQEKFTNLGAAERPETAGVIDLTTSKKSETEKMQFDIISEIGKESGLEFIVIDDWKGVNGSFFRGTNRVVLSRNAEFGLLTRTAGHEAYHYVEQYAPETAAKLRSYVLDALREKGEDIDTLLEKYAKQTDGDNPVYETREKQEAELVADSMFDVFSNRETVYKLANENMSLTKKIKRVLDRTISLIANKLNIAASMRNTEGKITNPEIKALVDEKEKLSHISELMKEGLAQAKKNREAQSAEQKNNTAEAVTSTKNEFSYDELIKKPDMFVTTLDKKVPLINGRLDRKTLKTIALNSLSGLDNGKNNLGRNYVYVKDIDDYVSVNSKSIEHGLSRNATATAYATTALGNILNNSIMINKLVPRESNVVSAYILLGMAADDTGNMYPTRFIVNVYKDGNSDVVDMEFLNALYSAKAQKNETWRTKYALSNQHNANAHSGFNISISELLDIVKDNYPDILPEEVLKDYGFFERPKSEVSDDILYSRKNEETPIEAMFGFYSETIKENRGWQLLHSMLEIQTNSARKGIHFKGKDIENVARDIKNEYSCSLTLGEIKERLNVLYDYIANQGTLSDEDMNKVNSVAAQVARGFLESSTSKDTVLWEQYEGVRELLKNTQIYFSENLQKEVAYQYGSFKNYRNLLFGKVNGISTKNTEARSLDEMWQELSELAPEYFPKDANELDMPTQLLSFYEAIAPRITENFSGLTLEEETVILTKEILDSYVKISKVETEDGQYKEILSDYLNKNRRAKAELREKIKEESKKEYSEKLEDYKQKREYTEKRRVAKNKIENNFNYLIRRYEKGNDNDAIPEKLRPLVRTIIDGLPQKGQAIDSNKIDTLIFELSKINLNEREGEQSVIDELIEKITVLKQKIETSDTFFVVNNLVKNSDGKYAAELPELRKAVSLDSMTNAELSLLLDVLNVVKHTVKTEQKMFSDNLKESRDTLSKSIIDEVSDKPDKKSEYLEKTTLGLLKPHNLFKRFGSETIMKLFDNLRNGENIAARIEYDAKIAEKEIKERTGYDLRWRHQTKSLDFRSGKIDLTVEQMLAIYATSKREQGKAHLLGGGIKIYTTKDMQKAAKAIRKTEKSKSKKDFELPEIQTVYLTQEDLDLVSDKLSPEAKRYADAMVEYITNVIGEKRNEVSMRLYGIKKYREKYYFPIMTDKAFLSANLGKQEVESKIQYQSSAHSTVTGAENAVIISDFTGTVNHHIYESALYCGYVVPIADFNKVFNFKDKIPMGEGVAGLRYRDISVQSELRRVGGQNAISEIKNFMVALDSGSRTDNIISWQAKLMSKVKKSAVMGNLSVVIQQPTSIYRAMHYIDKKYFGISTWFGPLTNVMWANREEIEEMRRYNGCALIKDIGYFDVNMGRTAIDYIGEDKINTAQYKDWMFTDKWKYVKDNSMDRLDYIMGWAASKADEKTWGAIWKACKKQTKAENPGLSGEALCEAAAELFQKTISETQVYDSIFTKCAYMRKQEGLAMMMMQFMSEPITSLNMYYQAVKEVKNTEKGTPERKQANANAARAFGSCILSTAYCAVAKGIIQSMRDDDEDKSALEKWVSNILTNLISDPIGMLPLIKDFVSELQGYDLERTDAAVFGTIAETMNVLANENKGIEDKIFSIFKALSQATGIPFMNIARDTKAFVNLGMSAYKAAKLGAQPTTLKGVGNIMKSNFEWTRIVKASTDYEQLYDAIISDDTRHYNKVYDNLTADGKDNSTIEGGIADVLAEKNATIKDAYALTSEGKFTEAAEKIKELKATGFSENIINKALNTYESQVVNTLKEDERTKQAAQARYNRNYDEYEKIIKTLVEEGHKETMVIKAIEANKTELESKVSDYSLEEEDTYNASYDLRNPIINGDDKGLKEVYNRYVEEHGEEDAQSKMKSQIVKAGKERFITESKAEILLREYVYNEEINKGTRREIKEADEKRENDIFWTMEEVRTGNKKWDRLRSAVESESVNSGVVEYYTEHGVEEKDIKKWFTDNYKDALLNSDKGTAEYNKIYDTLLDGYVLAGMTEAQAKKKIREWYKD